MTGGLEIVGAGPGREVENGAHTRVSKVTHVRSLMVTRRDEHDNARVFIRVSSHAPEGVADGFVISFGGVPNVRLIGSYPRMGEGIIVGAKELVLWVSRPISYRGGASVEGGGKELTRDAQVRP